VPLPEADEMERTAERRDETTEYASLSDRVSRSPDEPDDAVYNKLLEFVTFMKAQAQNRAKRDKSSKALLESLPPEILRFFASAYVSAEMLAPELYEIRNQVRISLRKIVAGMARWQVPVFLGFERGPDRTVRTSMGAFDSFVNALERFDSERIRQCRCKRYFYALRSNQNACSVQCAHVERTRRWREKQGEYEQRRKFKRAGLKGDDS
jgi:hypothetical protein